MRWAIFNVRGAIGRPGDILGIAGFGQSEDLRADHSNRRVALEHVDGGICNARPSQQIEQQPSPPQDADIGLATTVGRFLARNLANVTVAIESAPFEQDQERANVAATILQDFKLGPEDSCAERIRSGAHARQLS